MIDTVVETDVLIVGSGPAGASAALALSTYGVPNIVVTRYHRLADTPRAHITNQRTMEVLRDLGVEDQVIAQASPQHLMGNTTFCTSIAGEELGRLRSEFNAHGVDLNQRYTSTAIVPDGTPGPGFDRDPELYHQPSTRPGAKLPHAWLSAGTRNLSTLDLAGRGRFTVITGIGGDAWTEAARSIGEELGLDIATAVIGPGREYDDPYGDWARLRETGDGGVLLVRPDLHIAFRHESATPDDAARLLSDALKRILGRDRDEK